MYLLTSILLTIILLIFVCFVFKMMLWHVQAVFDIESEEENPMIINRMESFEEDLLGKVVSTEEEAYNLYNSYAMRTGFSVRRGQKRYNTNKQKFAAI
ncbi:unnamed protein product [Prunus armeniaca]